MKIVPVADIKAHLSSYLEQCVEGPIIVTKNGRPVAALVAVTDDIELEQLILAHTPRFRKLLDAAEQRIKETGGIKHEDFWDLVDQA